MNSVLNDADKIKKGSRQYVVMMDLFRKSSDVSCDREFQKKFNGFYIVRYSCEDWQPIFYRLFEDVRTGKRKLDFGEVLTSLWEGDPKHRVAYSFVSKMFATIETDRPIIDINVLKSLRDKFSADIANLITKQGMIKGAGEKKIANAVLVYGALRHYFAHALESTEGQNIIRDFDAAYAEYAGIPNAKKFDFWLWAAGSNIK